MVKEERWITSKSYLRNVSLPKPKLGISWQPGPQGTMMFFKALIIKENSAVIQKILNFFIHQTLR